jgi:ATP-dependent Clp protease protease subunit
VSMGLVPHVAENINGSDQMTSLFDRELVKNRTIYISGPIDSATALLAVAKLYYLSDISDDPITIIFVDCPGGSVTAGWAIYDAIQNVACEVSTVCMGMCASMGAFLLASGTKGKRIVTPNSEVMIHQPSAGTQGMVTDMEINIEHFQRVKRRINATLAKHTGKSEKQIKKDSERDHWMSAEEAVAYGLADEIDYGAQRRECD